MNSASAHPFSTTMLITIFLATMLINFTHSAPLSYATYGRRDLSETDRPEILVLVDQSMPELESEMFESGAGPEATMRRTKRIGSLSIVNSLDVLRQRVLLELARRKALQDQRQIDANRRFLETIGKRSVDTVENRAKMAAARLISDDHNYAGHQEMDGEDQGTTSNKNVSNRKQTWFDQDDAYPERQSDQARRMQANMLRLL